MPFYVQFLFYNIYITHNFHGSYLMERKKKSTILYDTNFESEIEALEYLQGRNYAFRFYGSCVKRIKNTTLSKQKADYHKATLPHCQLLQRYQQSSTRKDSICMNPGNYQLAITDYQPTFKESAHQYRETIVGHNFDLHDKYLCSAYICDIWRFVHQSGNRESGFDTSCTNLATTKSSSSHKALRNIYSVIYTFSEMVYVFLLRGIQYLKSHCTRKKKKKSVT